MLQRRQAALRALRTAGELLASGPGGRDPAWAWWFDRAELDGHHGLALARLGDLDAAAEALHSATTAVHSAATGGEGPAYRAVFAAELIRVLARAGAWREADHWLSQLAESVPRLGSARAVRALEDAVRTVERGRGVTRALRETSRYVTLRLPPTA
jgi:hypothetical protein